MRILHGVTAFLAGITIATGTALILSGCGPASEILNNRPADPPAAAAPAATTPIVTAAAGSRALTKDDVELTVKVTSKQCFGSAGCSLEYKVDAAADLDIVKASGSDWDITYEITGDTSGPIVGTLTFQPDGSYLQDPYMTADTKNTSVKLKIRIVGVEKA